MSASDVIAPPAPPTPSSAEGPGASPSHGVAATAPTPADGVARLIAAPYRYNLFQAISVLERAVHRAHPRSAALGVGNGRAEGVRFSAHIALHFPSADIQYVRAMPYKQHVNASATPAYVLSTAVLSLAGAQGPLPLPFTELILQRTAARDHATSDFLDIFHHRFLSFLYRSRKKHTPSLHTAPLREAPVLRCMAAMANLGDLTAGAHDATRETATAALTAPHRLVDDAASPAARNGRPAHADKTVHPWLQHVGLLGAAPRSMVGLLILLRDRLKVPFTGEQFVGAWQSMDVAAPLTLGAAKRAGDLRSTSASDHRARSTQRAAAFGDRADTLRLDGQCALGQRFWDQSAGITLRCVLHDHAQYDTFLPGGDAHALLVGFVRAYLQAPIDVHLVLRLVPRVSEPVRLQSAKPMRLGWSSWLAHRAERADTLPPVRLTLGVRSLA